MAPREPNRSAHWFIEPAAKIQVISLTDDKLIDDTSRAHLVETHGKRRRWPFSPRLISPNADILIVGAFGHSEFREFIPGGVKKEMLADCESRAFRAALDDSGMAGSRRGALQSKHPSIAAAEIETSS